jgi:hypothetical protein
MASFENSHTHTCLHVCSHVCVYAVMAAFRPDTGRSLYKFLASYNRVIAYIQAFQILNEVDAVRISVLWKYEVSPGVYALCMLAFWSAMPQ